jgi:integrase
MAKNGNGEGSIYEHKKKGKKVGYRGAYWVHTAKGPKRRYVSGKTREEVRDKLIEALENRAQGLVFDAGSITVEEYLTSWLKDSVKGTVHVNTYEVHRHMIEPHIIPTLGRIKLRDLNPVHVHGPDICFHDLRHTCATLLLSRGHHPKLVQELLGHATIAMTLNRYSHVTPGMGDQTAAAMEAVLS